VTIRKAVFLCDWHSEGGPFTFLQRATANLEYFGWRAEIVIVPSSLPCTFNLRSQIIPTKVVSHSYSWRQLGKRLALAISDSNPDVVVGFPIRGAPVAMRRLYRAGRFSARFLDLIQSDLPSEYVRVRANSDFASAVGCVSEACIKAAVRDITQVEERIFRVYYPVPCESSPPALAADWHRIRLAYLGTVMQQYKRVLDFIPLVTALLERNVDFELTIIGDGTERHQLEQGFRSIPGASTRVRFLGLLPNQEALQVLSRQDVLLLLSEVEGQPIAMLEAMALGVVPVVSDLAGLREIIVAGENGFLVPVGATTEFASKIEHLARTTEVRRKMALAAWKTVFADHEMKTAVGRFAETLETVCGLPLPDRRRLAPDTYPDNAMNRYRIPHYIQGLKRRLMKQVVF
jgi:glycosyltransferase involved in cell wall biosynthesis